MGNFAVGQNNGLLDLRGEAAKAGAENNAERGFLGTVGSNVVCGGEDAGVEIVLGSSEGSHLLTLFLPVLPDHERKNEDICF